MFIEVIIKATDDVALINTEYLVSIMINEFGETTLILNDKSQVPVKDRYELLKSLLSE